MNMEQQLNSQLLILKLSKPGARISTKCMQCVRDCLLKLEFFSVHLKTLPGNVETFHLENGLDFYFITDCDLKYIPFERYHVWKI